jgi:hypothetical protein
MNQSNELDKLATALVKAQSSLNAAKKDGVNPHFKSNYATLQSVWDSAREVLAPNGLSVVQTFDATDGKLMNIRTTLMHNSGQWIAGVLSLAPQQANPQGIGSAVTYGRRYALAAILGIVADEDDDGNQASHNNDLPQQAPRAQPAPQRAPARQETAPAANVAPFSGDWRKAVIHFGKQKGAVLGAIPEDSLQWWMFEWQPRPYQGRIDDDAKNLRAALDRAKEELTRQTNTGTGDSNEDIPF